MRRYMVDELTRDYIKLAKVKGLSYSQIMFRHVLRTRWCPWSSSSPSPCC